MTDAKNRDGWVEYLRDLMAIAERRNRRDEAKMGIEVTVGDLRRLLGLLESMESGSHTLDLDPLRSIVSELQDFYNSHAPKPTRILRQAAKLGNWIDAARHTESGSVASHESVVFASGARLKFASADHAETLRLIEVLQATEQESKDLVIRLKQEIKRCEEAAKYGESGYQHGHDNGVVEGLRIALDMVRDTRWEKLRMRMNTSRADEDVSGCGIAERPDGADLWVLFDAHDVAYVMRNEKEARKTAVEWDTEDSMEGPHEVRRYVRAIETSTVDGVTPLVPAVPIAQLNPEEAQMLLDLAEHSLADNEPTEVDKAIMAKLAAMARKGA